jgi:hypothetical protein
MAGIPINGQRKPPTEAGGSREKENPMAELWAAKAANRQPKPSHPSTSLGLAKKGATTRWGEKKF